MSFVCQPRRRNKKKMKTAEYSGGIVKGGVFWQPDSHECNNYY